MGAEGSQGSRECAAEQWEGRKAAALCFGTLFGDNSIGMFPR